MEASTAWAILGFVALNNLKRWSNFSYASIAMESVGIFSAETNSCVRCGMRRNSRISLSTSRSSDDSSKCWMDVFLSLFKKTRIAWNWRRCSVARNKNWKLDSQDIAPEPDQSSKKSKTTEHPYHEGELLLLKWHWIPPKHFRLELSLQSPHGVDRTPTTRDELTCFRNDVTLNYWQIIFFFHCVDIGIRVNLTGWRECVCWYWRELAKSCLHAKVNNMREASIGNLET